MVMRDLSVGAKRGHARGSELNLTLAGMFHCGQCLCTLVSSSLCSHGLLPSVPTVESVSPLPAPGYGTTLSCVCTDTEAVIYTEREGELQPSILLSAQT